jgi:hypothetical protein
MAEYRGLTKSEQEGEHVSQTNRDPLLVVLLSLVLATTLACPIIAVADAAADMKAVAGKWVGQGRSAQGTNPLEWTIAEDGKVDVVASTPSGTVTGQARVSIKDGKLSYESGTSSGNLTLQDGGRRLRYEGLSKRGNFPVGADMTRAK